MADLDRLAAALVAADSVNPTLVSGGAGEAAIARLVAGWLTDAGLTVRVEEPAAGRPVVVARTGRRAGGRTLLLLGHTDTVGAGEMRDPFGARVAEGRLRGRGAYDMKGGLAAAMAAAAACADVRGEVVLAAVCDEEAGGIGTRGLLASGLRADAAIVPEPTDEAVCIAHKGFTAFAVETRGRAAHGSRPDLGVDAIVAMGPVLVELRDLDLALRRGPAHPLLGRASLHAGRIDGGQEDSTYPAACRLTGEWRSVPGDDAPTALAAAVDRAAVAARLTITYEGAPLVTPPDAAVVRALHAQAGGALQAATFWADSALLAAAGIPTALFGPSGAGAHADEEWVDLASLHRVRDVLAATARAFCS